MGTNTTRSNKRFIPVPRLMSGGSGFINRNVSPYFYGVVTFVDPETRVIQYDTIENNIGTGKLGNAIPAYKDNITLPQVQDVVPLFTGPSFESGVLGEQYTKTVYYGNPISVLQELSENSLVRSSEFSAVPPEVIPDKENYLISDIGLSFTNDQSTGTLLLKPATFPYNTYKSGQKLPNGKLVPSGYVIVSGDCNDSDSLINPSATEICWNNTDDNCDGNLSEGCAPIVVNMQTANNHQLNSFATAVAAVPYNYSGGSVAYRFSFKNNHTGVVQEVISSSRFAAIPLAIRNNNIKSIGSYQFRECPLCW
jgi:hypothetical protein